MKKLTQCLAVALLIGAFSQPIFADDKTAPAGNAATTTSATSDAGATKAVKPISMSNLLQQLQKAGYTVKEAEFKKDDNLYKVDAIDRHGDKQSLDVAATGLTAEQKKVPHEMSASQAVKQLEKNGATISHVSSDSNGYKVSVIDSKGNQQDYTVDYQGKVTK